MDKLRAEHAFTPVSFAKVIVNDGFWAPRVRVNRERTIPCAYDQCRDTGRLDAFRLEWKPGQPNPPHIFWDSDVAKWIEAAAYSLATCPDADLEQRLDEVIARIAAAQQPDGYLNTHYTVVEPGKRWTNLRDCHELYCAGHLIEAAVAHFQATGKRTLLDVLCRYADHIGSVFGRGPGQKRGYSGHEEIELALVKLSRATGEPRYRDLARYFVDERGQQPCYFDDEARARGEDPAKWWGKTYAYCQAHVPVRAQEQVTGHAVRAMYLYSAMAELAGEDGDVGLQRAGERLWQHLCTRNLYLTGGIGSARQNEGFTADYDLPNETAYAETCAAIGLVFWNHRLLQLDCDGRYADVMERALYNGVLSGVSLDGRKFFYENPLASRGGHHRQEWFGCACCPPNVARLLASLGEYVYSESATEACVHLYVQGAGRLQVGGQTVTLTQRTQYPWDGAIAVTVEPTTRAVFDVRLRVPGWCRAARFRVNGESLSAPAERGYARIRREWAAGDVIELNLAMPVEVVRTHPLVRANAGRVALQRGPVVYCLEEVDNGGNLDALALAAGAEFATAWEPNLCGGVTTISGPATRLEAEGWGEDLYRPKPARAAPVSFRAVPYCVWDNRAPGEMLVWIRSAG